MKGFFHVALAALALVAGADAFAQPKPADALQTRLDARRVVTAPDGKESFDSAATARPGDVIEYVATYRNTTRQPIRNLQAGLPIPAETEFLMDSPKPAAVLGSTDGQAYAPLPLTRKVQRNGVTVDEAVPASDIRYLRWTAPELRGEQSVTFTARVRVRDDRATGPPATSRGSR